MMVMSDDFTMPGNMPVVALCKIVNCLTCTDALQAHFHGYAVAGDPSKLTHGDYYAGKGVGHAVLQTPAGLLSVFNTHLCANYSHKYTGICYCHTNAFW